MIARNPKGHYIAREAALYAWLPLMLKWLDRDALTQALNILADWCSAKISERYYRASHWLRESPADMSNVEWTNAEVVKWRLKREIILKAIADVKAVDL